MTFPRARDSYERRCLLMDLEFAMSVPEAVRLVLALRRSDASLAYCNTVLYDAATLARPAWRRRYGTSNASRRLRVLGLEWRRGVGWA